VRQHQGGILPRVRRTRRLVTRPEELEQVLIRNDVGVEVHLEALSVIPDIAIGGIRRRATRVANPRTPDSLDKPELGVRTPESTRAEGRRLQCGRHAFIERWDRQQLEAGLLAHGQHDCSSRDEMS